MIYSALVMDNSSFFKTGTIRVRIQNYYYGKMTWDLSQDTAAVTDGYDKKTDKHKDFDAFVFSPIGGGKNYGMFLLPEPNTKGIVVFMGNPIERSNKCFWLGSIFEPTMDGTVVDTINIPSDKVSANGTKTDGFVGGEKNSDVYDGAFVLRLKSTSIVYEGNAQNPTAKYLDWEKNNTENLIVINKDKVIVHHASSYDSEQKELSYQEISLTAKNTNITMSSTAKTGEEPKIAKIEFLNDDTFGFDVSVSDTKNKKSSSISSIDGELVINNTIDKNISKITQSEDGMTLSFNDNSISITDDDITLAGEKATIYVVGKEIRIGNGNSHILTSTTAGSFNTDNGMIIQSSDTIFG